MTFEKIYRDTCCILEYKDIDIFPALRESK